MAIRDVPISQDILDMRKECILHPRLIGKTASLRSGNERDLPYWRSYTEKINGKWKTEYTHRIVWKEQYGEISKNNFILHTCGNSKCINILHLRSGTPQQNMQDKIIHGNASVPRKRKLNGLQSYEEIIKKYKTGLYSQNKLAQEYGIIRESIRYIVKKYINYF